MAITRKPKAQPSPQVDVDSLINKGGSVTRLAASDAKQKRVYVQLRLPQGIIDQIDQALSTRPIKVPRHTWFLEAIHEKLERG